MKIGILTYHRTHNYGACLQAVATRFFLEKLGHEVYYIDYWPKYHQDSYKVFNKTAFFNSKIQKKILSLIKFPLNYYGNKQRIDAFTPFLEKYILPFCKPYNSTDHYDAIIYGSDQIWRKQKGLHNDFDSIYFGDNILNGQYHIAYAASMGSIKLSHNDEHFLRERLHKLNFVGIREQDLFSTLNSLNIQNLQLVCDPTFLLSNREWDDLIPNERIIKEKYVLLYQIGKSIDRKAARKFADAKGLKLIVLASIFNWRYPKDIIATPNEFISLIKNAEYVLTGSFHGLAFSVIYSKEVYASFKGNSNRALTLLTKVGIKQRLLPNKPHIPTNCDPINYQNVSKMLHEYINESKHALETALKRHLTD